MTVMAQAGKKVALTGNEAIARGAMEAGVSYVASYPGSPTAEIPGVLALAAAACGHYVEWSVNEKVAMEGAAAASFAGLRSLVVMKADGLNVALDFAGALALSGCRGGLVVLVGDDPAAHSSIREEDTRTICKAVHLPVLEPSSVAEARDMTREAFSLSEFLALPVVVRCVTRVCHASGDVTLGAIPPVERRPVFGREDRVITFSARLHALLEQKMARAAEHFAASLFNAYSGPGQSDTLIIASGPAVFYAREARELLEQEDRVGILKLGTTWPLPASLLLAHLRGVKRVIFAEEVEPFIEDGVMALAAAEGLLHLSFYGKRSGHVAGSFGPGAGELDVDILKEALAGALGLPYSRPVVAAVAQSLGQEMPVREFALCAGCPHRASFWAVKAALELDGRGGVVIGDIGCYTLGMAGTGYHLLQTVHSMGSGVGIAGGLSQLRRFGFDRPVICVLGDSTFYHAALPALVNARFHRSNFLCILLDNETTAMTGHQPHPGRLTTAMGEAGDTVLPEELIRGMGLPCSVADPYDVEKTAVLVCDEMRLPGPRVLLLRRACALVAVKGREKDTVSVDPEKCLGDACGCARFCSRVFGCPANIWDETAGRARIDEAVCSGCGVCAALCPRQAIVVKRREGVGT